MFQDLSQSYRELLLCVWALECSSTKITNYKSMARLIHKWKHLIQNNLKAVYLYLHWMPGKKVMPPVLVYQKQLLGVYIH